MRSSFSLAGRLASRRRASGSVGARKASFYVAATLISTYVAIAHAGISAGFLDLVAYMNGDAAVPFQYRVLPVLIMRPGVALVDALGLATFLTPRPPPFNDVAIAVLLPVNVVALVASTEIVRARLASFGADPILANALSLGMPLFLTFNLFGYVQGNFFLPYDIISVFFFTYIVLSSVDRPFFSLMVFTLAVLNRETAIYAAFICFLAHLMPRFRPAAVLFCGQVLIWVAVKTTLWWVFQDNPKVGMGVFEVNIRLNLSYLSNPMWWPQVLSMTGFLWAIVILKFRLLTDSAVRMAVICFPAFVAIMLLMGRIVEMRIFAEYTPIFYLAAAQIFLRMSKEPSS